MINNAGVLRTSTALSDDAIESLKFELDANVYGLMHTTQAFAPVLKANGGGAFVQLNSVVSMKCFPEFATYCASRAAAYSITQALRAQLAEQGTVVVSVHPGPIATDMGDAAGLTEIAEPPALVGRAIVRALKEGDFHAFPDSMAKQIGEAYRSFAQGIVEADLIRGQTQYDRRNRQTRTGSLRHAELMQPFARVIRKGDTHLRRRGQPNTMAASLVR